jgi:hypothetical protein
VKTRSPVSQARRRHDVVTFQRKSLGPESVKKLAQQVEKLELHRISVVVGLGGYGIPAGGQSRVCGGAGGIAIGSDADRGRAIDTSKAYGWIGAPIRRIPT